MKYVILALSIHVGFHVLSFSQSTFPEKYLGVWEGNMLMMSQGKIKDSVDVIFTIAKTDEAESWTWRTQYLSEKFPMVKDYVLRVEDKENQVFVIDEGEGLVLYDYMFGNKLYSVFETGGFLLTSSYEFREDEIVFEVSSGKLIGDGKQEVNNYTVRNLQRVVLTRKEE